MTVKKKHYNLNFVLSLEHLKEFFKYFRRVTDLRITLLDETGKLIIPSQGKCSYCMLIAKTPGRKICRESDKTALQKAAELKTPYIYTCTAGLVDIVIPLFYENTFVGGVITGQVTWENSPPPDYSRFFPVSDKNKLKQLKEAYCRVKRVNKNWLNNTCNMLFHLLNYIINVEMKNLITLSIGQSTQDVRKKSILRAKEYIDLNFKEEIDLNKISSMYHLTPFYFSKLFREHIKINFKEYLQKLRIEEAKKKLAYSRDRVIEIAYEIGFQDSNYFSSVFKKFTGLTPTQYRKMYKTAGNTKYFKRTMTA